MPLLQLEKSIAGGRGGLEIEGLIFMMRLLA